MVWDVYNGITLTTVFDVKGVPFTLKTLLGDSKYTERFVNGNGYTLQLHQDFYHHYHSPVKGVVLDAFMAGFQYFWTSGFPAIMQDLHRGIVIFNSTDVGLVAMVAVGFGEISSVTLRMKAGEHWDKGEEVGRFAFGGSAVVTLFEPQRVGVTDLEIKKIIKLGSQTAESTA